jgi:hypothetical protein
MARRGRRAVSVRSRLSMSSVIAILPSLKPSEVFARAAARVSAEHGPRQCSSTVFAVPSRVRAPERHDHHLGLRELVRYQC